MFMHKVTPQTAEVRILRELRKNKLWGVFNHELAKPSVGGLGYRGRLSDLRKDGYNIQCVHIKRGSWKYYLNEEK